MKKSCLFFVAMILSFTVPAQVSQINDPFLKGGKIRCHAKNASCVLVGTKGGIFKTVNQGQSFTNASQNFDPYSVNCEQLVSIGTDYYAMTNSNYNSGVYKSADNGSTWSPLTFSNWWPQSIGKLGNTLYAVGGNNMTGDGNLYSSVNGVDWTVKANVWTNWNSRNCRLYSFNQDKLYIYINDTYYYTTDGNILNPITISGLGSSGYSNNDGEALGDALGNFYFRSDNKVFKYNFITAAWVDISTGKIPVDYQIMNLSVTDHALFFAAMSPTLGMIFYKSLDQGTTFTAAADPGIPVAMIGNIIEVSNTGFIGTGLYDEVLVSSDGGDTWSENANQYNAAPTANLTRSGNSLLFSTNNRGLILSSNLGVDWSSSNSGIPGFGGIAYFVEDIIQAKDTLFSFLMPDPYTKEVSLYKSTNNGNSWAACPIPVPYNAGNSYLFAGKCDSALFVSYLDKSNSTFPLIVSYDNGGLWFKPSAQNSSKRVSIKGTKNCLFASYFNDNDWNDFDNIYKVNSFGVTFSNINTNGLFSNEFMIKRLQTIKGDKADAIMDFDASSNIAIFVVRDRKSGNNRDRLYLYNNTTGVWSETGTTGLPTDYLASSIKFIGLNTWLLGTNTGLYRSLNGGASWAITHDANGWQKGMMVNSIQVIGRKSFLGTLANGVWMVDLPTGLITPLSDVDLKIFPNPTADFAQLIIPDYDGKTAAVSVYDFEGKEVMSFTVTAAQLQLDLRKLPSGTYFVVVQSNHKLYRKAIIRK